MSNHPSLVQLIILLCFQIITISLFMVSVLGKPNNISVSTTENYTHDKDNVVVLAEGDFTLEVRSWRSGSGYLCMAGVKITTINPGSTIWTANNAEAAGGTAADGYGCSLRLSSSGLSLIKTYDNGSMVSAIWSTIPDFGLNVSVMSLLDSGNLVLQNAAGEALWQSFEQTPVFAILPGMKFSTKATLYSTDMASDNDWSTAPGKYALSLQDDGTLYLYQSIGSARADTEVREKYPAAGYVYWSDNICRNQNQTSKVSYMSLNQSSSFFQFYDAETRLIAGNGSLPRMMTTHSVSNSRYDYPKIAILDREGGHFTVYDHITDSGNSSIRHWEPVFSTAFSGADADSLNKCHRLSATVQNRSCGFFSLCNIATGACYCPDGFAFNNTGDCAPREQSPVICRNSTVSSLLYKYVRVPNVVSHSQLPPVPEAPSETRCTELCSRNCDCTAAIYDSVSSTCALFSTIAAVPTKQSGSASDNAKQILLLKTAATDEPTTWIAKHKLSVTLGSIAAAVVASTVAGVIFYCSVVQRLRLRRHSEFESEFLDTIPRLPPRFTLNDLDVATQGFVVKLGSGSFGSVYGGELPNSGTKVAVKKLDGTGVASWGSGSGADMGQMFQAELISIGAVSHVNLVKLKGFCFEGGCRLLVYEYMANGSLDRWLFDKDKMQLSWEQRFTIALDTAKGLAYLHHECGERIVHCDIKPENILLDEKFRAKLADFGLAKLMENEKQGFTMTTVKGTRGYLAPEWLMDSTITAKSDVYSYGVVLLELISGRRSLDAGGYLPAVAMKAYSSFARSLINTQYIKKRRNCNKLFSSGVSSVLEDLIDPNLTRSQCRRQTSDLGSLNSNQEQQQQQLNSIDNIDELPLIINSALSETTDSKMEILLRIGSESRYTSMMRMMKVALWCVQIEPGRRPDMASVVQMMEGAVQDVAPPPPAASATTCDAEWLRQAFGSSWSSGSAPSPSLSDQFAPSVCPR